MAPGRQQKSPQSIGNSRGGSTHILSIGFGEGVLEGSRTVPNAFSELQLVSFSFVGDDGNLYENFDPAKTTATEYGCAV